MKSISSIAANRFLKKINSNAFYCDTSLLEAYSNFDLNSEMSFSSFYKYVGDEFKKPHRFSDLCKYCEHNKVNFLLNLLDKIFDIMARIFNC